MVVSSGFQMLFTVLGRERGEVDTAESPLKLTMT